MRIDEIPEDDQVVLDRYSLQFRTEYQLLVCARCNATVTKSFADHIWTEHQQSVDAASRAIIHRYLVDVDSVYLQVSQGFLDPVDFRPVIQGYKCSGCEYYSANKKVARLHSKTHEPVAMFVECSVQRMNNSKNTPYIGVNPRREVLDPVQTIEEIGIHPQIHAVNMLRSLDQQAMRLEEGRRENLFYNLTGFLLPNQLAMFADVNKQEYVRPISQENQDDVFFFNIRNQLMESIQYVNNIDVQLRFAVSHGRRPFKRLETLASVQEYSLLMIRFVRFLVLLVQSPVDGVDLPNVLREKIALFFQDGHMPSLWSLIIELLKSDPRQSEPSDPFTLFIRFCCTARNEDILKADQVERVIAKVSKQSYFFLS